MCRLQNLNVGIKSLDFVSRRGKMAVKLSDGREMIVPLSMFPDIKRLSVKDRQDWMVLDDQFFTFAHLSKVFSIQDLFKL